MFKTGVNNNRGVVLFVVLVTLLVVVILANILLSLMVSQSRLTHHQVSRIQAYYAGLAGMNLAFEKLRLGNWTAGTYNLRRGNTTACAGNTTNCTDPNIPYNVTITITDSATAPGNWTVRPAVNYTYTEP